MKTKQITMAFAFTALLAAPANVAAESVTILGGGIKGGAYAMAVGLSKLLKDKAGMDATPQTSGGMVAQARLLAKGDAQFAFGIGGPIGAWAFNGQRRFEKEGPKKNLRAVFAYPFGNLQWVTLADSDIKSVKDLKGKPVSVGKASSTTQTFARIFLPAHGIEMSDVKERTPGFAGGFNELRNGNVVAHLTVGKTPISALREMATTKAFRLVDMDEKVLENLVKDIGSGVSVDKVPPNAYGSNQKNSGPVSTLALFFGFSTSAETSPDLVYKVTKTLFDNLSEYQNITSKAKAVKLEAACEGLAFPLHEGAKRYYKEVGVKGCDVSS